MTTVCIYIINYFNSVPQLQFLCFNCFGNRDIKLHLANTVVWSAGRSTKNQFELFPPCPSTSDACSALPCQRHASSDRRLPCSLRELKSTERSTQTSSNTSDRVWLPPMPAQALEQPTGGRLLSGFKRSFKGFQRVKNSQCKKDII